MISQAKCFELRFCSFYEYSNLEIALFAKIIRVSDVEIILFSVHKGELIYKYTLYIAKKRETCRVILQYIFFSVNITVLSLTNPDVNLKIMHRLYILIHLLL